MARKPIPVPGWERIPGNAARRYRNTVTGQEISRFAYQTLQHGMNPKERAAENRLINGRKESFLSRSVKKFKARKAAELGLKPKQIKVRGQSAEAKEFRALYKELKEVNKKGVATNEPGGRKAKLLEAIGLREKDAPYPVNESPDKDVNNA